MSRKTLRGASLAIALAFILTAPASPATGRSGALSDVWSWWARLWVKALCISDPNGDRCASTSRSTTKAGGCIDPDGGPCAPAVNADHGPCIDPDG